MLHFALLLSAILAVAAADCSKCEPGPCTNRAVCVDDEASKTPGPSGPVPVPPLFPFLSFPFSLPTVRRGHLPFAVCRLLFAVHRSPCTVRRSPCTVCAGLPVLTMRGFFVFAQCLSNIQVCQTNVPYILKWGGDRGQLKSPRFCSVVRGTTVCL